MRNTAACSQTLAMLQHSEFKLISLTEFHMSITLLLLSEIHIQSLGCQQGTKPLKKNQAQSFYW